MTVVANSVINYSVATKDVSYGVQIPPGRNIKATSAILYGLGTHARSAGNQQVNNAPNQVWVG